MVTFITILVGAGLGLHFIGNVWGAIAGAAIAFLIKWRIRFVFKMQVQKKRHHFRRRA